MLTGSAALTEQPAQDYTCSSGYKALEKRLSQVVMLLLFRDLAEKVLGQIVPRRNDWERRPDI
jgi:hypothetical protein